MSVPLHMDSWTMGLTGLSGILFRMCCTLPHNGPMYHSVPGKALGLGTVRPVMFGWLSSGKNLSVAGTGLREREGDESATPGLSGLLERFGHTACPWPELCAPPPTVLAAAPASSLVSSCMPHGSEHSDMVGPAAPVALAQRSPAAESPPRPAMRGAGSSPYAWARGTRAKIITERRNGYGPPGLEHTCTADEHTHAHALSESTA
jgi:hypothetical protein